MRTVILLILFLIKITKISSRTVFSDIDVHSYEDNQIKFMQKYGYLPEPGEGEEFAFTPDSMIDAVKSMQAFGGLPQTGILDEQTKSLFTKKRCGTSDIGTNEENNNIIRKKRFSTSTNRWNKKQLTFKVKNAPRESTRLDKNQIEALMKKALDIWAPHVNMNFSYIQEGEADITTSFDDYDGQGGNLAYATYPPNGKIVFDIDENWTANSFLVTALHELGHALGLNHSTVEGSVMKYYFDENSLELHEDDIAAMHELYPIDDQPSSLNSTKIPSRNETEESDAKKYEEDKPDLH